MMQWAERYYKVLAAILLVCYTGSNWYGSTRLSLTGDEAVYFAYGVNMLKLQPQKKTDSAGIPIFNSQMPINALGALPRAVQQVFNPSLQKKGQAALVDIYTGRLFSVLSALLLGLYVLVWATQWQGKAAGLLALLLYCLCPNIAAHSQLLGTDVFSYLIGTATCYHCWRYGITGRWQQFFFVAVGLGLGQLTKQSLLLLYPVVAFLLIARLWFLPISRPAKSWRWLREMLVIGTVSLLLINAGFLFYKTGQPLSQYQFVSAQFKGLQQELSFIKAIPLPLPEPFVRGFDYVRFNTETGPGIDGRSSYGDSYFLGEKTGNRHIWYYYIVCLLYKLPLPFLLLVLGAFVYGSIKRQAGRLYLLLPVVFWLGMFSAVNNMYLGVRTVLLVVPLLCVYVSSLLPVLWQGWRRWLLIAFLLWELISVGWWWPHLLPYTNELIWNKARAHEIFTDSNIYFQEGGSFAEAYLQQHPGIVLDPLQPVHGKVLVSIEHYYDVWNKGTLAWLRALQLQPIGHVDSGYLLFEVP